MENTENLNTQQTPVGDLPSEELNAQQAISILIQAVNYGQSKGIYSLEDAAILSRAVKVFVKKEESNEVRQSSDAEIQPETIESEAKG